MRITPFFRNNALYLRFSHQSKWHLWLTPYTLPESKWNAKRKQVRANFPDAEAINQQLAAWCEQAQQIFVKHAMSSSQQLKHYIDQHGFQADLVEERFVDFAQQMIADKKKLDSNSYRAMIGWVMQFDPDIKLNGWTRQRLDEFERFVLSQHRVNSQNTVANYLKRIRAVLNRAIAYNLIDYKDSPYNIGYKIKHGPSKDIKLSLQELQRMYEAYPKLQPQGLKEAALAFLLSYALDGLRVSDLYRIKCGMIQGQVLRLRTKKTGYYKEVEITPLAMELLAELGVDQLPPEAYIFPQIRRQQSRRAVDEAAISAVNAKVNQNLKLLAQRLELPAKLHMHAARHTFAYLADQYGAGMSSLMHALTHKNLSETSKYIGGLRGDTFAGDRRKLHGLLKPLNS